jgi:hypothetical protein
MSASILAFRRLKRMRTDRKAHLLCASDGSYVEEMTGLSRHRTRLVTFTSSTD